VLLWKQKELRERQLEAVDRTGLPGRTCGMGGLQRLEFYLFHNDQKEEDTVRGSRIFQEVQRLMK
jgi:hypothetical protein